MTKLRTMILAAGWLIASAAAALAAGPYGPGTGSYVFQCAANQQIGTAGAFPSSQPYTAPADGIIVGVNPNDVRTMQNAGCENIFGPNTIIARLIGANFNVTTDQPLTMLIPQTQGYIVTGFLVKGCSTSLTTAKGAVYDAAAKSGNTLFGGSTQVMTACTGAGTAVNLAPASGAANVVEPGTTPPILSLTTAQGAAATANVYVFGQVIGQ